jgi:hypothetical protein
LEQEIKPNESKNQNISFEDMIKQVQASMVGQDVSKISQEDLVNNLVTSMMGQNSKLQGLVNPADFENLGLEGDEEDDEAYDEDEGEEEEFGEEGEEECFDENEDDLNSEERAELEELQNQGFNPMQTLGRLIAGLDG